MGVGLVVFMIMLLFVTAWAWRCGLAVPLTGLGLIF